MVEVKGFKEGLEDVVAADSAICYIDGTKGILSYRGIDIHDLADHSTFEEVCFLLWEGRLPKPDELLQVQELAGLPQNKIPRLHGIARAALEGELDREPLLALDPNEAYTRLQELPGIGPFYAGLILIRAVGTTDVAPKGEPRLEQAVQARYGRPLDEVSDGWRPFRTWISVLMRAHA